MKLKNAHPDVPIEEGEEDEEPLSFWLLDRGWTYDTSVFPETLPEREH